MPISCILVCAPPPGTARGALSLQLNTKYRLPDASILAERNLLHSLGSSSSKVWGLGVCFYLLVYCYLHFDHLRLEGDSEETLQGPFSLSDSSASANLHTDGKATSSLCSPATISASFLTLVAGWHQFALACYQIRPSN